MGTLTYKAAGQTLTADYNIVTDPAYLADWGGLPVWRDEFTAADGTAPSSTRWNLKPLNTKDAQETDGYRDPAMAFIQNNQLIMRTQLTTPRVVSGTTVSYASPYLDTIGKFSQRYGRWEIRLKALEPMHSRGIWPAFWLRDNTGGGENDIYEAVGTPCAHPVQYPNDGSAVSSTMYQQTGVKTAGQYSGEHFYTLGAPIWDFHTYACEWTPSGMQNYIDGVPTLNVTDPYIQTGFSSAANIRLDVYVGTTWAGRPNTTDTRNICDTIVDYVRVWKYVP